MHVGGSSPSAPTGNTGFRLRVASAGQSPYDNGCPSAVPT